MSNEFEFEERPNRTNICRMKLWTMKRDFRSRVLKRWTSWKKESRSRTMKYERRWSMHLLLVSLPPSVNPRYTSKKIRYDTCSKIRVVNYSVLNKWFNRFEQITTWLKTKNCTGKVKLGLVWFGFLWFDFSVQTANCSPLTTGYLPKWYSPKNHLH